MKTREEIITSMCYTVRHDYGLDKNIGTGFAEMISAGMTTEERGFLYNQMSQIYDNDIKPVLEEYRKLCAGESIVVPKDKEHAEALVKMGMFYLEHNK